MKFASKKKLSKFLEMTNQSLDPEDFDFTPYGQQQEREPLPELADQGTSAHFGTTHQHGDEYVFPRIHNTASQCPQSHRLDLDIHGGRQNNANLQRADPVIMIENNPHSILLEVAQPQVLNLSLNQTLPQPLLMSDNEKQEEDRGGVERAKMLATAINAATRDSDPAAGERLASTSSLLTSSAMSEQRQSFTESFSATYNKATTSCYLPNFDLI